MCSKPWWMRCARTGLPGGFSGGLYDILILVVSPAGFYRDFILRKFIHKSVLQNGKISFISDDNTIAVVCDVGGGYFRIQDLTAKTKKKQYLNLDGTNGHNYKDSNGKIHGRNKSEYNRATHFRIKKREEMQYVLSR